MSFHNTYIMKPAVVSLTFVSSASKHVHKQKQGHKFPNNEIEQLNPKT